MNTPAITRAPEIDALLATLRLDGIHDDAVLEALAAIPREMFVAEPFVGRAWENVALPISKGQTISQPYIVALMTQALQLNDRMKVLEVGTGSGYQAAILARLARRVYTLERQKPLLREAENRFRRLGLHTISTLHADGGLGWKAQAPFDRIIVTASAQDVPPVLVDQLAIGGIMVVPVGEVSHTQILLRVMRTPTGIDVTELMPVRFVPMLAGTEEF
ncbi:protein-L-isoaspartate(D-aspartate) O-methyltransferase [Thalassospira mesophila]|uniref:Protein-L-isoaspartate O-methyltransferase n=1 Tax=Thalassospira mesophila TaxID=1293891 RepID=A0A1Y2L141_9PROT|nr:protein-L-isoaspartate(D-aspartate) O-methyltransferase [Thalassospira mesophila]OSQ37784.1 protein-L-isoaspartate O-methyltransferase [Thalassospira mesophila]